MSRRLAGTIALGAAALLAVAGALQSVGVIGRHASARRASASPRVELSVSVVRTSAERRLESGVAAALNGARRTHGLRPLTPSPLLARAGEAHLRALADAGEFTHSWPDGRPLGTWAQGFFPARPYRLWKVGENLFWVASMPTPHDALQAWLSSPEHRRILLAPDWRQLGIGVVSARSAAGVYGGRNVVLVAAEFGLRR